MHRINWGKKQRNENLSMHECIRQKTKNTPHFQIGTFSVLAVMNASVTFNAHLSLSDTLVHN